MADSGSWFLVNVRPRLPPDPLETVVREPEVDLLEGDVLEGVPLPLSPVVGMAVVGCGRVVVKIGLAASARPVVA